jgi:hypothetical protein
MRAFFEPQSDAAPPAPSTGAQAGLVAVLLLQRQKVLQVDN